MMRIGVLSKHCRLMCVSKRRIRASSNLLMGVKPQELKMPALSPTMTEGTIVKWLKKEGDVVSPGDALCDIQTDKAIVALEVEESGVLAKILVPDDTKDIKIGTLIALLVEEGEDWKDVEVPSQQPVIPQQSVSATSLLSSQKPETPSTASTRKTKSKNLSPAVRTLLNTYSLDASVVSPSGPHGILLKGDILKFIASKKLKPVPLAAAASEVLSVKQPPSKTVSSPTTKPSSSEQIYVDVPNSNMRQTIARRLTGSKTAVPHSYCTVDCSMDATIDLRKQLKADGNTVSINDFIIKAVAVALQRVPEVNAQWVDGNVRLQSNIDVSVAVASEAGLITPIIKDAVGLGISEISQQMKELSGRARIGKLKPEEFLGGTFTVSNLGMFGITEFTAIINPPQCAILAVGTSRAVLTEDGHWCTKMMATLSYDNRVFGENVAAHFLEEVASLLENPALLLAGSGPHLIELQSEAANV